MDDKYNEVLNPEMGYKYGDLYNRDRLEDLLNDFHKYYKGKDSEKYEKYKKYFDSKGKDFEKLEVSSILIDSAPILSDFLGELFMVQAHLDKYLYDAKYEQEVLTFKKEFVQKQVMKKFKSEDPESFSWEDLDKFVTTVKEKSFPKLDFRKDEEKLTAHFILELLELEKNYRWFYEGDKFAPEGFEIPSKVTKQTKDILEPLISAGLLEEKPELENLRILLDKIREWMFVKYYKDPYAKEWISYFQPHKTDYDNLVEFIRPDSNTEELIDSTENHYRIRNGFKLNDFPRKERDILNQVDYCMLCHERDKDSCSVGLNDRFGERQKNPVGNILNGCPLEEKISESHAVRKAGYPLASLCLITIDNPMCPGTGHRICNDCMKGCIFQKQEPVNIPLVESNILREVLYLPYGFEIYDLLTRWNPLNVKCPVEKAYNGKNILVVGLGPAGYTLSHHLLNQGFGVAAIDALKIEPIFQEYTGYKDGVKTANLPKPVKFFQTEIQRDLDERVLQGFGGVTEYGITVRWDKNFLSAIYLNICRRDKFKYYDGVRFGGTLTIDDIWDFGFDHIAIASGAAKPTIINLKNNLAKGIRKSSDFLMALQLTGAQNYDNPANLQIQLPAIVIGGGLTAIDCSTELIAYYPVQVEKVLRKYEEIAAQKSEAHFWKIFSEEEKEITETFLEHARLIREEKANAEKENREPRVTELVRKWGDVRLVYRKRLHDAPSYRENHEEIIEALEQGVQIMEKLSPLEAVTNKHGAVESIIFDRQSAVQDDESKRYKYSNSGNTLKLPAKTVIIAAGTSPNVIYESEYPGTFKLDKWGYFAMHNAGKNAEGSITLTETEEGAEGFFTSYSKNGKLISFYGDNHPVYYGNVVRAMASTVKGCEAICQLYKDEIENIDMSNEAVKKRETIFEYLTSTLDVNLVPRIESVKRVSPDYSEVVIKAPFAADKFKPGHIFRLQNYEVTAGKIGSMRMLMENLALAPSNADSSKGTLSFIVEDEGVSSKISSLLKNNEKVVFMGPTGEALDIPQNENVLLAGSEFGVAALIPMLRTLKDNNNKTLLFAHFKNSENVYKIMELEECTGQIVWCYEKGEEILRGRNEDLSYRGNITHALKEYSTGSLGKKKMHFDNVNRLIVSGGEEFTEEIQKAREGNLKSYFNEHTATGSVYSPMQCMMKGVCAQCLQKHIDPETGKETIVYSCANHNQYLDEIDFENLGNRLNSNSVLEKLGDEYLEMLLDK